MAACCPIRMTSEHALSVACCSKGAAEPGGRPQRRARWRARAVPRSGAALMYYYGLIRQRSAVIGIT